MREVAFTAEISGREGPFRISGQIDRLCWSGGDLLIVDYKTGGPPTPKQVEQGYALQLGVLGLIAEAGGFDGLKGSAKGFEYWSLSRSKRDKEFGFVARKSSLSKKDGSMLINSEHSASL